jgi:hypothetical protein
MVGSDQQGKCKEDQSAEKALANAWKKDFAGLFFAALLILWVGLVLISIQLGHKELWPVIVGLVFFEVSSRVFSSFVMSNPSLFQGLALESCPDFLNTSISLLHSTIIALAGMCLFFLSISICPRSCTFEKFSPPCTCTKLFCVFWHVSPLNDVVFS